MEQGAEISVPSLSDRLQELGADALLVVSSGGDDPDRAWFTGGAKLGDSLVVVPRGGAPRLAYFTPMERDEAAGTGLALLAPERLDLERWTRETDSAGALLAAVVAQALFLSEIAPGRLAVAGRLPLGLAAELLARLGTEGWSWVSGGELLLGERKHKRAHELGEIRRVARATASALRRVAELLAAAVCREGELWLAGERLRIGRLKSEVALCLAAERLEQPRGNILAPGEEGGVPHSSGTLERVVRAGETLVVDLYPRGQLFADCTRTFCLDTVPEAVARAHAAVRETLALAHRLARPGARGWDLQLAVCERFAELGFPTPVTHPGTLSGYVHGLGHGVGYELHEQPSFRKTAVAGGTLETGDALTLEPGLYEPAPGGYGIRLEDLVWLGPEGLENLTPLPLDLDPRALLAHPAG